jgi:hypothetical protein
MIAERIDMKSRDVRVVEKALPAHMMFLMMEECQKIKLELRADVMVHLNRAAIAPLVRLDELSVARVARRIDETARILLRDLAPDDPRHGLYSCAMFVLVLVEEGRLADVGNQAVLTAMLLMEDIKDDRKDDRDQGVVWRLEEQRWKNEAKKLIGRSVLMGLYAARSCK